MESYSEKLKSPKWQKKRLEIFQRDNWKCQKCGNAENELIVHHTLYEKGVEPWEYDNDDLMTLCVDCHENQHNITDSFHIMNSIEKNIDTMETGNVSGVSTGFVDIDLLLLGGLQKSEIIIIAGDSSVGKTSFSLNIARNIAVDFNIPVAIFSLEMSQEQVSMRMICSEARLDSSKLRSGFVSKNDWVCLTDAAGMLSESPIFIDASSGFSLNTIARRIRNLKSDKNIGIAIIDYIQLLSSNRFEISEISRRLKIIAKEADIPIIVLSQVDDKNIIKRSDKRPLLSDLKGNDIGDYADIVMFLYREELYNRDENNHNNGIAEVIVAKQRNGHTGTVLLKFLNIYTRFENYKSDETPHEK